MKTETTGHVSMTHLLEEHPLFRALPPAHLNALVAVAMIKEFAPNEMIFREGDPANRFYVILEGEVALEQAREENEPLVIQTIGAQDVLGWSWLFPPFYWHFDARAIKPTRAIFFYGTWLREHCEHCPEFGYEMLKRITSVVVQRLQATRRRLTEALESPVSTGHN